MKAQPIKLGDLDLQVTFQFPGQKTMYRTITYPTRPANLNYGRRSCLNLATNKDEMLMCNKEVVPLEVNN